MNLTDSNISGTPAILHAIADMQPRPPDDLWARIRTAHTTRMRRRRLRRFAAGGILGAAVIGAVALGGLGSPSTSPNRAADIDWQARAQALELQLQELAHVRGVPVAAVAAHDADPAAAELADVDQRLQAAYEHGRHSKELIPLWKRRSELLDALIVARKEGLTLTSI